MCRWLGIIRLLERLDCISSLPTGQKVYSCHPIQINNEALISATQMKLLFFLTNHPFLSLAFFSWPWGFRHRPNATQSSNSFCSSFIRAGRQPNLSLLQASDFTAQLPMAFITPLRVLGLVVICHPFWTTSIQGLPHLWSKMSQNGIYELGAMLQKREELRDQH